MAECELDANPEDVLIGREYHAPEQDLALEVLLRALSDARIGVGTTADWEDDLTPVYSRTGEKRQRALDCGEARAFLFSTAPAWKQSREAWCHVAGVDPGAFDRMLKKVNPSQVEA